jgi:type III secretion protein J
MKRLRPFALLVLLLVMCGCTREEVISGLTERQAADVISILSYNGVPAEREKDTVRGQDRYRVTVSEENFNQAIVLIRESVPPDDRSESLENLLKTGGLTPLTPELHAARLDFALAMQVERQLLAYPGVVYVRSSVSSKLGSRSASAAPSASVVIRFLSTTGNVPFLEEDVRQAVSKLVPGLQPQNVAISVSNVVTPRMAGEAAAPAGPLTRTVVRWPASYSLLGLVAALVFIASSATWLLVSHGRPAGAQRAARVRKPTDKVRLGERL